MCEDGGRSGNDGWDGVGDDEDMADHANEAGGGCDGHAVATG